MQRPADIWHLPSYGHVFLVLPSPLENSEDWASIDRASSTLSSSTPIGCAVQSAGSLELSPDEVEGETFSSAGANEALVGLAPRLGLAMKIVKIAKRARAKAVPYFIAKSSFSTCLH